MSDNMDYDTAAILFRPICSKCKHILYDTIDYIEYPYGYDIIPNKCPFCNEPFESIEIPTTLPFKNE